MDAGVVSILGVFAIPIVAIICYYCHETIKAWNETALKRDMVARGYSASEIVDVVSGVHSGTSPLGQVPPAKPIKQPV
jgi:hypothetical protein